MQKTFINPFNLNNDSLKTQSNSLIVNVGSSCLFVSLGLAQDTFVASLLSIDLNIVNISN